MCMWVWRPRVGWLDVVVHTSSLLWCLILGRVLPTTKDVWYDVCMPTWVYTFVCLYQCIHVGMIRCLYELMYVHIGNVGTDDTYREKNVAVRAYECCLCFGYIFSLMYSWGFYRQTKMLFPAERKYLLSLSLIKNFLLQIWKEFLNGKFLRLVSFSFVLNLFVRSALLLDWRHPGVEVSYQVSN